MDWGPDSFSFTAPLSTVDDFSKTLEPKDLNHIHGTVVLFQSSWPFFYYTTVVEKLEEYGALGVIFNESTDFSGYLSFVRAYADDDLTMPAACMDKSDFSDLRSEVLKGEQVVVEFSSTDKNEYQDFREGQTWFLGIQLFGMVGSGRLLITIIWKYYLTIKQKGFHISHVPQLMLVLEFVSNITRFIWSFDPFFSNRAFSVIVSGTLNALAHYSSILAVVALGLYLKEVFNNKSAAKIVALKSRKSYIVLGVILGCSFVNCFLPMSTFVSGMSIQTAMSLLSILFPSVQLYVGISYFLSARVMLKGLTAQGASGGNAEKFIAKMTKLIYQASFCTLLLVVFALAEAMFSGSYAISNPTTQMIFGFAFTLFPYWRSACNVEAFAPAKWTHYTRYFLMVENKVFFWKKWFAKTFDKVQATQVRRMSNTTCSVDTQSTAGSSGKSGSVGRRGSAQSKSSVVTVGANKSHGARKTSLPPSTAQLKVNTKQGYTPVTSTTPGSSTRPDIPKCPTSARGSIPPPSAPGSRRNSNASGCSFTSASSGCSDSETALLARQRNMITSKNTPVHAKNTTSTNVKHF
eukprot:TRINITY_DN2470_c0_g1_i1.p1 TRINITY_DN2470_c0_g1~~TRINITY_DN2470_c0_g1_i1.p1  ORF type:complete len:583 (+),score=168.74 TRINITY_DN2470_c0_g1_i1:24-1751(+)